MWTEEQLISDLASKYKSVGTPRVLDTDDKNVTLVSVNVFDIVEGTEENVRNVTPVARRVNIEYYVLFRGDEEEEEAYYKDNEPTKLIARFTSALTVEDPVVKG